MANEPMDWGSAMLSLLSQNGTFYDRLHSIPRGIVRVRNRWEAGWAAVNFAMARLEPYEPACRRLIAAALKRLRVQAGARGVEMPDGLDLRASAGLLLFDWGKSECSSTHITMRLIATHAEMMDMPICVEERVLIV